MAEGRERHLYLRLRHGECSVRGRGLGGCAVSTKSEDKGRRWMWWFLAGLAAVQLYFVRELLAVFAMFTVGFAMIAAIFAALYMARMGWEVAVARLARSAPAVVDMAVGVKANQKAS